MKLRIILNCPLSADNLQVCGIVNEFGQLSGGVARDLHIGGVALMVRSMDIDIIPTSAVMRNGGMVVKNKTNQ